MEQTIVSSVIIKTEAPENEKNNISSEDFPFICRICFGRRDLRLFEEEWFLWELFLSLTKFDVLSAVNHPKNVCNECINKLEDISLFIDISKYTDLYYGKKVQIEEKTLPKPDYVQEYDNRSSRYCRACLSSSDLSPFEEKIALLQLFQEITEIDVRANTNVWIENSICSKCTKELQKAIDFLNLSMNNNEALRRLANIDTKKEVLRTDGDGFECLMGMNDVKDECTDEYIATDIEVEMLFDDSANGSFESFEETNENKTLHARIDLEEDLPEHMTYSGPSNLESCILSRIESKSSEDIQEQIEIGIETDQLQSSKDKKFQSIEEKAFKCDYCSKEYSQKKSLQIHLLIHSGEKSFRCYHCDKKFTNKFSLQRHLLTHTGEKPFECNCCRKRFARKDKLQRHLLTHSGEEPFTCGYCNKTFAVEDSLRRHFLVHTKEKPFKSDDCGKRFSRKDVLQNHSITHISGSGGKKV